MTPAIRLLKATNLIILGKLPSLSPESAASQSYLVTKVVPPTPSVASTNAVLKIAAGSLPIFLVRVVVLQLIMVYNAAVTNTVPTPENVALASVVTLIVVADQTTSRALSVLCPLLHNKP